jgi:hypothetical protein
MFGRVRQPKSLFAIAQRRYDIEVKRVGARWTLEKVVAELRALHAGGESMDVDALRVSGHAALIAAAQRHAGTWTKALRLAGLEERPTRRRWTRRRVIAEIQALHRSGASLMATAIENNLSIAANRLFGGWRNARAIALPDFEAPYERWSKAKILERLRELHAQGASLAVGRVREEHAKLVSAAIREFGSWDAALKRGIAGHESRRTWNQETVKAALRRRQRERKSLNSRLVANDDPGLTKAAREQFGRWRRALEAAGVATAERREAWSHDLVKQRLRELAETLGYVTPKLAGAALTSACRRYFGSFKTACFATRVDRTPRSS